MDRSAAERLVKKDLDETTGLGKPLSSRARMAQRSVEAYLKAGVRPRWMERVAEIDDAIGASGGGSRAPTAPCARSAAAT